MGQGPLRTRAGEAFDSGVAMPASHQDACRAATLRSQKRQGAVRAWRRAQKTKALEGHVCVRFDGMNEAFDIVDRHDVKGYTLDLHAVSLPLFAQVSPFSPFSPHLPHLPLRDGSSRH